MRLEKVEIGNERCHSYCTVIITLVSLLSIRVQAQLLTLLKWCTKLQTLGDVASLGTLTYFRISHILIW